MSLVFLKIEDIQDSNLLSALDTCQGKSIIYGEKEHDVLQGLVLVDITKQIEIKAITLFDQAVLPRLIEGVKNKYKNKDIFIEAGGYDLSSFGFIDGRYIRADHLEDAFLNIDRLVERYPAKVSEKEIVLNYLIQYFELQKRYTEQEVNELLKANITFEDYVTLRRDLYDFGYLSRLENGAEYQRVK